MRRREVVTLVGAADAAALGWPFVARAQMATPVVGFLTGAESNSSIARNAVAAFRQGLAEAGFVEGKGVAVAYRFAEGEYDRLPDFALELVRHPVAALA